MTCLSNRKRIEPGTEIVPRLVGKDLKAFPEPLAHPEPFAELGAELYRDEKPALGIYGMSVFAEEHPAFILSVRFT